MRHVHRHSTAAALLALAAFCLHPGALGAAPDEAAAAAIVSPAGQPALVSDRFVLPVSEMAGIRVAEISGLAWDAAGRQLYGVSDRGYLVRFDLRIDARRVGSIEPVFAAPLVDPGADGGTSPRRFNAEGLTLRKGGDTSRATTELVVALEHRPPQIARFDLAGTLLGYLPVPAPADDMRQYRKKGRGLESVVVHPVYGLMTAPESPLIDRPDHLHTIYAEDGAWSFPRYREGSRLKGFDALADGSLLVLERSQPGRSKGLRVATLRRVDLARCDAQRVCRVTDVATLPAGPENFEGMTVIDDDRVLLVSDSGDSPRGTVFSLVVLR